MLNVSERTVREAKKVIDSGDGALIEKIKSGEVTVTKAAKEVSAPPALPPKCILSKVRESYIIQ